MDDIVTEVAREKHGALVTVNETERLRFNREAWCERSVEVGEEIDLAELRKWLLPRQYPEALNAAVRLLAVRSRSEAEICRALRLRGYMDETIDMVSYQLERNELVNDEAFAREWAKARVHAGLGKNRILMELRQKGVDSAICESAVNELSEDERGESGKALAAKLLKRYGGDDARDAIQKVMAGMSRRGYGYDEAKSAIEKALHDAETDA